MGLDMYLIRKTYVKNWEHTPEDEKVKITLKGKRTEGIDINKITYIEEEFGYWRKANAIHNWFVKNVQEGIDDCKEYYVEKEQLKELLETVNKVLKSSKLVEKMGSNGKTIQVIEDSSVAEKLLPTTEGFFFGSTDYDEFYYNDLQDTKEILEEALKVGGDFYYQSSW